MREAKLALNFRLRIESFEAQSTRCSQKIRVACAAKKKKTKQKCFQLL